jgi:catechol 2,3-dioxygenase-like lactoylglutathione lyase family enzyme
MIAEEKSPATAQSKPKPIPFQIRKLGHVVFYVSDLERSVRFYTEILPFKVTDVNEHGMVFLCCATDHHTLALAPRPNAVQPPADYLKLSHFALEVSTFDDLFRIRDWLREHQVPITFEGRKGPGGNPGVEFQDPDGYTVELYAGMDQIGWDGRSRPSSGWRRVKSLEEAAANPLPPPE